MPFSDTDRGLFNVIVVSNVASSNGPFRHSQVCNAEPLSWSRAVQMFNGIMTGIGKEWEPGPEVDCDIEPVDCPRPWSPETLAAFNRVCGYAEQPGREGVHVEMFQKAADRLAGRAS